MLTIWIFVITLVGSDNAFFSPPLTPTFFDHPTKADCQKDRADKIREIDVYGRQQKDGTVKVSECTAVLFP